MITSVYVFGFLAFRDFWHAVGVAAGEANFTWVSSKISLFCLFLLLATWVGAETIPVVSDEPEGVISEGRIREVELQVLKLCNEFRESQGLAPFLEYSLLSEAAVGHSEKMLELGFFSHESPLEPCRHLKDRLQLNGCQDLTVAENIYRAVGYYDHELAEAAMKSWLRSPAHRKNLSNPVYTRLGLGIVGDGKQTAFTQVFSYTTIEVTNYQVVPRGEKFEVTVSGVVVEGRRNGGLVFKDEVMARWEADQKGEFRVSAVIPEAGRLWVAQESSDGDFRIESVIQVGKKDHNH